jgi:hypothetical protein
MTTASSQRASGRNATWTLGSMRHSGGSDRDGANATPVVSVAIYAHWAKDMVAKPPMSHLGDLTASPAGGFAGIVFSDSGHSYLPPGWNGVSYDANVSAGPDLPNWPSASLTASCEISAAVYINLDNPIRTVTADIVVHEMGHALGMGSHFAGFGDGPAINADFWDALGTLYGAPAGTNAAAVAVVRVN